MADAQFEHAVQLEKEGVSLEEKGDYCGAVRKFSCMRDLLIERAAKMPDDPVALRHVASAGRRMSYALYVVGRYKEAIRLAKEGFRICERQCRGDPIDPGPERDLNLSCDLLASVLKRMGRPKDAIRVSERGIQLARWLESIPFGDEARKRHDLGGSLECLALTLDRAGRPEDALGALQESVGLARGLVATDGSNRKWRKFLASTLSTMGGLLRRLDRSDEARGVLDEAIAAYDRAFDDMGPAHSELQHRAVAHRRAGKAAAAGSDLREAERHLSLSVDLGREAVAFAPGSLQVQGALQSALAELAIVLQRRGDVMAARSFAREAAALDARLRKGRP